MWQKYLHLKSAFEKNNKIALNVKKWIKIEDDKKYICRLSQLLQIFKRKCIASE